ncbi:beta-ketoacyl synthase N-terminal-like domain-containing protein [Streptomyces sp. NRRL S-1022]|uniref:beta-ketoacyl synthase N-terminal-like domain-containing protein n=1 Tax=Streptomyces sp. NRRL S-1022 TaxID=1463880 RepID=UPI0004C0515D|nr:beta-ketoacyl synthase N-terminal-like domain-containing protein [Streptomyces sp. NRRL S-1022]
MHSPDPPDVLVTGVGAVSCLGPGTEEFWAGLKAADSRPHPVPGLTERVPDALAYQVTAAGPWSSAPAGRRDRATEFALHAAREAVADAGLTDAEITDMAVVIGTAGGATGERDLGFGPDTAAGRTGDWQPLFTLSSAVADAFGAFGTNLSVSNACAASGYALTLAMGMVRRGEADTVLVGGADALGTVPLSSFSRLGANDPKACRPFDENRRGTVFGEGAAMLVVQSARVAGGRRRYGRLRGSAWSCDAHHPTAPDPEGGQLVRVAREALREARTRPEDIGLVIPHGTGTEQNDALESRVLREVLREHLDRVPLFSLKAFIGHSAGAAAAFAAVCAALIARHGQAPANVPLDRQDAGCDVWLPQRGPTPVPGANTLLSAYGFGGANFSMVFGGDAL